MAGGGEVEAWVAERRPGWSLPRQLYLSPQAFERDMARVFMRGWSFVGHIARIPAVGDYFLHEIGDESIVVMRSGGGDTAVSAFFNVCRHRASRICLEAEGHATSRLVCPYHAWSYTLEGELASARHMGADFDRAAMGLHRCAVRVVEGLIFMCPEPPGPDLGSFWDQTRALFAPHGFRQAKVARRTTHRIRANWKVFAENFWECYHCTHAHPEFCQVMSYPAAAESPRRRAEYERFVSDWRHRARQEGRLPVQVELSESKLYQLVRTPIRPGFLTQTRDGQPVAPLMGQFTRYDGAISAMQMFPLNWIVASNDHAMAVQLCADERARDTCRTHLAGRRRRDRGPRLRSGRGELALGGHQRGGLEDLRKQPVRRQLTDVPARPLLRGRARRGTVRRVVLRPNRMTTAPVQSLKSAATPLIFGRIRRSGRVFSAGSPAQRVTPHSMVTYQGLNHALAPSIWVMRSQ